MARLSYRHLEHVAGATFAAKSGAIVMVVPYYGNASLLAAFLRYYRQLGVDQFVFLDLSGKRDLAAKLSDPTGCAIWRPRHAGATQSGIHWLNYLRGRYATGRWCLSVEPSDFFVYPRSESRHLRDLTEFLENEGRNHIYAVVVETYGDKPADSIHLRDDDNPLCLLPYFDAVGYVCEEPGRRMRNVITLGGLQRRTTFADNPERAPALNRIPLVKWRWNFSYVASTRLMAPPSLNTPHARWHSSPTTCLLRCALLDDDRSLAIAERVERTTIITDRATPSYSGLRKLRSCQLKISTSIRFTISDDLVEWGLMTPGQWF